VYLSPVRVVQLTSPITRRLRDIRQRAPHHKRPER
jgi:hypothetical protein